MAVTNYLQQLILKWKVKSFLGLFSFKTLKTLPFSFDAVVVVVVVVTVGIDDDDGDDEVDNLDVVDDNVEVVLLVGVVTLDDCTASAHTSIGDGCVSFARFSSVDFVSVRGKAHIDGFELSSAGMSVLDGFVELVVELTVPVVVSMGFGLSVDVVDTAGGVHIELDEKGNDWPVVVVVS